MTLNRLTILSLAILTCMFCWDACRWESGWFMVGALAALVALIDVALESSMSDCDYPRRTDSMPPWVVRAWTIRTLAFAAWSFLLFWEAWRTVGVPRAVWLGGAVLHAGLCAWTIRRWHREWWAIYRVHGWPGGER